MRAASTAHIRYRIDPGLGITEDEINARVRRIHPSKDARSPSANPVYAERTGRLTVPLITLHETGDAWVPLSLEQSYRRRTIAAGTDHLLVQRVMRAPSHCGFDGTTRIQAFDDLVAWIERGVRPVGEDVLAPDLSRIGLAYTPALFLGIRSPRVAESIGIVDSNRMRPLRLTIVGFGNRRGGWRAPSSVSARGSPPSAGSG